MSTAPIVALGPGHLGGALVLSTAAGWNQVAADWLTLLDLGQGFGIEIADPATGAAALVASAVVLPHGARVGWVGMVLVLPAHRGRGHAGRLLAHGLDALASSGRTAALDATPAGRPVYRAAGFDDGWGLRRYRRQGPAPCGGRDAAATDPPLHAGGVRPLDDADWPALLALDAPAFGADRGPLLRALGRRLPAAAHVHRDARGRTTGYVLAREGRTATQIGPLVAADDTVAARLLDAALRRTPGPVVVDAPDARAAVVERLRALGFEAERPFLRMGHGAAGVPADPGRCALIAGPEFG